MKTSIGDLAGSELGDRPSTSIGSPDSQGPIAQEDAARDDWERSANATPDVTNTWVPDGYEISRAGTNGLPFCVPQPAYIAQIAKQAPQVMDRAVMLAATLLGDRSEHREAAKAVAESTVELLRTYAAHNVQFAFVRNLVYAYKNAAVYQSVVLAEQLDQHQRQVARAQARGGIVSENPAIVRSRSFIDQTITQLYVATQVLLAFDPKDTSGAFAPNWMKTAESYCKKRGENFTRSVLHKQVDAKQANTVDTFEIDAIAKLVAVGG